jgi:hypothetical protein
VSQKSFFICCELQIYIILLLIGCFRLKRKYNEFNKSLKQTGAGLTYDELQKNPHTKTLIGGLFSCMPVNYTFIYLFLTDLQLNKFPWWPDLHSWWRTNPTYNTVFSTTNSGQNYESAVLQHFCVPDCEDAQLHADENELQEDADIEDREIIDTGDVDTNVDTNANVAGQLDDNILMEPSDWFVHVQQAPISSRLSSSALSFFHGSTSTGLYCILPCHILAHPSLRSQQTALIQT